MENIVCEAPCADFIALCGNAWVNQLDTFLKIIMLFACFGWQNHNNIIRPLYVRVQIEAACEYGHAPIDSALFCLVFSGKLQTAECLFHVRDNKFKFHMSLPFLSDDSWLMDSDNSLFNFMENTCLPVIYQGLALCFAPLTNPVLTGKG